METGIDTVSSLISKSPHRPVPVLCLHHFLFTCLPSFFAPLLLCCKKEKILKKMRKSSSECSSSSSVLGQVFVGLCENLWTLFAISEMGPGQVGSVWPLSSRSSPSPDIPLGILPFRMSHPSAHLRPTRVGSICLSMPEIDRMNLLCSSAKPFSSPGSPPVTGLPAACLALWVSTTPSLGSAACFPGWWMLAPL